MRPSLRNRSTGYIPLRDDEDEALLAGAYDGRFDTPPEEAPMSAIALALFLMLFGVAAFVLAWMHFTQLIFGEKQAEVGFTIVGLLTFIPGAYHTWIALCVWRGVPGYSWADIPR